MTSKILHAFHYTKFRQTLINTCLKIIFYTTLNNAVFLYFIDEPLIQTRPWTLFLKKYWDILPSPHYLIWQLFFLINIGQIAWIIYQSFKQDFITIFHQTNYNLDTFKTRSSLFAAFSKVIHFIYLVLLSPFHYQKKLYAFMQCMFLIFAAYLIWINFFLTYFHAVNHYILNPKEMIETFKNFFSDNSLHPALKQAFSYASLCIISCIILIKGLTRLHQKYPPPSNRNRI
jgi:hypothetical protein